MDDYTTISSVVPPNDTYSKSLEAAISFRPFGITIAAWAIIVGSVGNLLTILTYVSNVKLRTTFNLFLVNLAIIDFWTAIGMLPFNLAGYVQMQWPFAESPFTARLQAFQYFSCGYTSVVCLIGITVNRFIGVVFPAQYSHLYSRNRTIIVLIVCNLFAPVALLPFLVGTDEKCTNPSNPTGALTGFRAGQFLCTFVCLPPDSGWAMYMQFTRVVFQFVPLVVMMVLYSILFASVKKRRSTLSTRMGLSGKYQGSTAVNGSVKSASKKKTDQEQRRQREDSRMALISVTICIAFTVTFMPSVIVNLLPNRNTIDVRWHMAASNLTWFNSSINPIVYVFLNRRFRREYWRIVKYAFGSVKGRFIHESSSGYSLANIVRRTSRAENASSVNEVAKNSVAVKN